MNAINLDGKFSKFDDLWAPRIIARLNDYHIKIAKCEGEFTWHRHPETDELFLVNKGRLTIRLRDRDVVLDAGDLFVVPRGVEHKPVAHGICEILLIEPAGTLNTGGSEGGFEASAGEWL